ncbi:aminopeptidase P N-terminal domain-containing protein [Hymenobacter tenuis]
MSFTAVATHNRQRFVDALLPGSLALITAPEMPALHTESLTRFRIVSDSYWLTGLVAPQSSLLLFPDHPEEALREVLFMQKPEKQDAGPGLTPEEVVACTGIATVRWHTELESVFGELAPLAKHIYLNIQEGVRPENADMVQHGPFVWWCLRTFPLHSYQRATPVLAQLRQLQSPAELALLRTAAHFSEAGFQRILAYLYPGVTARQIQAELLHEYLQHDGADWTGETRLVAAGADGPLRYRTAHEKSQPGDLVQLITAASYQQYYAAFTRTLPISGQFTPRQQDVYAAVLHVYQSLRLYIRAGQTPHEIQAYSNGLLIQELLTLGLFTLQELDQEGDASYLQQYSLFHLVPAMETESGDAHNRYSGLPAGAVMRCELGIRVPAESLDLRIGSTLVIGEGPVEDLTAVIPVEPEEWEALLSGLEQPSGEAVGASSDASMGAVAATVPTNPPRPATKRVAHRPRAKFWQYAHWLLLLPLLLDLGYSYVQHLNLPHDGDMVFLLTPRLGYQKVLDNPLALPVLLKGERYANPNRYFAHQAMFTYMRNMPLLLQSGVNAIYSVYMATAIAKLFFQALLLVLLAYYASERIGAKSKYFLIAALLVTPFFQTAGYHAQIGIIDRSITYTFFYAFPLGIFLLYFLPIYRQLFSRDKKPITKTWHILLPCLAIVLALNGPLIPAVAGLMSAGVVIYCIRHYLKSRPYITLGQQIQLAYGALPKGVFFQLVFLALCCAYSLYIGTFNAENVDTFTLSELYSKLFDGLWYELGQQAGFPVLLLSVLINLSILNRLPKDEGQQKMITAIKWLLVLSVIYIALLPFGGYRAYREFLIRRDTIMPVTLALVYLFSTSALYLLFNKRYNYRGVYLLGVIGIIAFYSLNDLSNLREDNREVAAQRIIASSPDKIVHLEDDCPIMNWGTITDYNHSVEQAKMMKFWNITKEEKLFYH